MRGRLRFSQLRFARANNKPSCPLGVRSRMRLAISMRMQMNRTHRKHAFFAFAWVGLAGAASCLSGDDAPARGRVEHPPPRAPMPVASAEGAKAGSPPPHEGPFTPLDQAIADDCHGYPMQSRAWSQNVPDRECTHDGECGDGFCDRGRCAAVRTCWERYGQRCVNGRPVPSRVYEQDRCPGICLDGRCRSCESEAECVEATGRSYILCGPRNRMVGRWCGTPGPKYGLDAKQAPPI
jgi:hypothetical protein